MLILAIIILSIAAALFALLALLVFRLKRPILGSSFAVLCLFFTLADVKAIQIHKMTSTKMEMPATTVTSTQVKEEDWAPTFSSVGSISPVQGAVVSAELSGTVLEVRFENGGMAKKGDILVRLDASSEEAQLHAAEADLELSRSDLERTRDLAARKVVSKAELDAGESKFKQKEGAVDNMRSMIGKKSVRAPFDGQLGIRQVNIGQTIDARVPIVDLQALDQVYVNFSLPQQRLAQLSTGLEVRVHTDAVGDREFAGKLTAINSAVDVVTRNVAVQATLDNADHALRPGMFAKVEVVLPQKHRTLVIPGTAVSYAPYGDSVYVIEKKKDPKTGKESQSIRQQFVRVGEARGDLVSVTQGLKAGETIVGTGVFKLRNGMAVAINNDLAPKPQVKPTPADT